MTLRKPSFFLGRKFLVEINNHLEKAKNQLENNENIKAKEIITETVVLIKNQTEKLESADKENSVDQISDLANKIKVFQLSLL